MVSTFSAACVCLIQRGETEQTDGLSALKASFICILYLGPLALDPLVSLQVRELSCLQSSANEEVGDESLGSTSYLEVW